MATITEIALFKACVERPRGAAELADLGLDKIPGPQGGGQLPVEEVRERQALKLYHMAWSALTKYIRTVCAVNRQPIEFPGLGIFKPELISKRADAQQDPASQEPAKLTPAALGQLQQDEVQIRLYLQQGFVEQARVSLAADEAQGDGPALEVFDPLSGDKYQMQHVKPLNLAAIAKVCDTDVLTIQFIVKEIVA